ncbi:MAG: hypothetical protein J6Z02_06475, partial [Lachnospiraceae bacterium]|nr:hypothetical protein [Lachnospiraceae bacterium]
GDETFLKIELEGDATMDKVGKVINNKYVEEGKHQLIRTMLEKGKTPQAISDLCDLPLEYVLKVQEESLQKA